VDNEEGEPLVWKRKPKVFLNGKYIHLAGATVDDRKQINVICPIVFIPKRLYHPLNRKQDLVEVHTETIHKK
jgi:hypothetical protein